MNNNMNSAMKTVGVSLAVGTAPWYTSILMYGAFTLVVLLVCIVIKAIVKRKMKKAAKKAANTINTIVDNMQDMIK